MNPNNTKKKTSRASLITSAISLVLLTTAPAVNAKTPIKNISQEQCAGLIKAGLNDCASVEHACAGLNAEDSYDTDWLWLPAGTCAKISGAHVIGTDKKVEK